jgi:hypothetical protein
LGQFNYREFVNFMTVQKWTCVCVNTLSEAGTGMWHCEVSGPTRNMDVTWIKFAEVAAVRYKPNDALRLADHIDDSVDHTSMQEP